MKAKSILVLGTLAAAMSVSAGELAYYGACSAVITCQPTSHIRMMLDGSVQERPQSPVAFKLEGHQLTLLNEGGVLGDGTLPLELLGNPCDESGMPRDAQFEASNSMTKVEFKDGRMLASRHAHHDFFELAAFECR